MTAQNPMFTCRGLVKHFKQQSALQGIDWDVFSGHIVGLLGSNGAGRSALLRHILSDIE